MNITLTIVAGSSEELQEAVNGLANRLVSAGAVASKSEPEKAKRVSKPATPTEKPQETKPEVESGTAEDAVETPQVEVDEVEIPTVVELRAEAQKHGQSPDGKKAIKALLTKFGSKSVSDVPEDKRAEFLAELTAL